MLSKPAVAAILLATLCSGQGTDARRSVVGNDYVSRIGQMHADWCKEHAGGSICAVQAYRLQQEAARDIGGLRGSAAPADAKEIVAGLGGIHKAPRTDPAEVRAMHEWWCEDTAATETRTRAVKGDGICLGLDVEHMQEWWCKTAEGTALCDVLAWRNEAKAGGMARANGEMRRPPPPMITSHEAREMMAAWCKEPGHENTAPCHNKRSPSAD